ncbi:MAG TPA: hypothetical protein VME22_01180 [Solirubrobacteraceae bacterium]|nr:hypothetical protein [Solirubrobacteraceae bacterium]
MPTIASPRRIEGFEPRRDPFAPPESSITLRIRVATHRGALTEQLAEGADPTSSPELTLRASQLTSDRRRRQLARSLRRTVNEVRNPAPTRALVSIVNRYAVFEANDAIQATIGRLASPDPVAVKGMAMLERILTDGVSSPLYGRFEPDAFRSQLLLAKSDLDLAQADFSIAA